MEDAIVKYLSGMLQGYSIVAIFLIFLGGLITSIGPCNVSMIPILMAYVGGSSDTSRNKGFRLSLAFTLGSAVTFMLLGIIASFIGGFFGGSKTWLIYLVALVCLIVGLNMLGIIKFKLPNLGNRILRRPNRKGVISAFVMGLTVGLAGSQCGTPVLLVILSLVLSKGKLAYGAILLFVYALGRGVPVVLAGTFTGVIKEMPLLAKWSLILERAAGVVLIAVGLYFIRTA